MYTSLRFWDTLNRWFGEPHLNTSNSEDSGEPAANDKMVNATANGASDKDVSVNHSPSLKADKVLEGCQDGKSESNALTRSVKVADVDGEQTDCTVATVGKMNILQLRDKAILEDGKKGCK